MFITGSESLVHLPISCKFANYIWQMENKRTQLKVAMNYGAMYGLSGMAVFLLFYFIGTDIQSRIPQWISYLLLVLFIVIGIKSYRDEELGGYISYGKSLGTGILISLCGGVISGFFTLIFFAYIDPSMSQKIIEASYQSLVEQGMSESQIESAMEGVQMFMTPTWLFVFSILGSGFMGLIFSLLISVFLRKEQNPFNSNVG
jgi:hypothetical protein